MSGVGKTQIGKNIAKSLRKNFIDTDDLIVSRLGLSIDHIFSEYGEEYFRKIEATIVEEVSTVEDSIISTGGGVVLNPENINNLKKTGFVFFLEAKIPTIVNNLLLDTGVVRPLFKGAKDLYKSVEIMHNNRYNLYLSSCNAKISVDNKDYNQIALEIVSNYDKLISCGKL